MFPAKFEYAAPGSLQEALALLQDPDAKILAGGHSLLPAMKLRLPQKSNRKDTHKDIGHIPGSSFPGQRRKCEPQVGRNRIEFRDARVPADCASCRCEARAFAR